jgi:hypothetical protein
MEFEPEEREENKYELDNILGTLELDRQTAKK